MSDFPRISIVTPSFNQAAFLRKTMESVLGQDYPNLEYIVMDGGSTDGSARIIEEYADRLTYWVSQKDDGQSDAINKGFAMATGDLLGWLNSDDMLFPGALRKVARCFRGNPGAEVVVGGVAVGDVNDRIVSCHHVSPLRKTWTQWGRVVVPQPSTFFSAELFRKAGGLRNDLHCELDMALWLALFRLCRRMCVVRSLISFFRRHAETKGQNLLRRYDEERAILRRDYKLDPRLIKIATRVSQFWKLANGTYLHSIVDTLRLRGMSMGEIWTKAASGRPDREIGAH